MIRFDEETHTYWDGEKELTSVTEYLKLCGLERPFYPEWYGERGTAVHKAIELLNKDILDWETVDPQIIAFVHGYKKAKLELGFESLENELIVAAPRISLAGTIDEVCLFPSIEESGIKQGRYIVDFKTGHKKRTWELQTAGYALAYQEEYGENLDRIVLKLNPDRTYEVIVYNDEHDLHVFLGVVNLVQWRNKHRVCKPLQFPEPEEWEYEQETGIA